MIERPQIQHEIQAKMSQFHTNSYIFAVTAIFKTIIPQACLGYEMIDSQRGARASGINFY